MNLIRQDQKRGVILLRRRQGDSILSRLFLEELRMSRKRSILVAIAGLLAVSAVIVALGGSVRWLATSVAGIEGSDGVTAAALVAAFLALCWIARTLASGPARAKRLEAEERRRLRCTEIYEEALTWLGVSIFRERSRWPV